MNSKDKKEFLSKQHAIQLFRDDLLKEKPAGKFSTLTFPFFRIFMILQERCVTSISQRGTSVLLRSCIYQLLLNQSIRCRNLHLMRSLKSMWHILLERGTDVLVGSYVENRTWSGDRLEQSGKEDYERSPIRDIEIKYVLKNALC